MRCAAPMLLIGALAAVPLLAAAPPDGREAIGQASSAAERDLAQGLDDLAKLREAIRAEKLPLSDELGGLENRLAALKRELDDTSRAQDTKALELGNLQAALKLRQDESTYVANLLDEYARGFESALHVSEVPKLSAPLTSAKTARDNPDLGPDEKIAKQVDLLRVSLTRLMDLVGGTRYEGQAVDAEGTVARGEFAMIGPIVLFAAAGGHPAGLAIPQTGSALAAVRAVDKAADAGIAQVVEHGEGSLPLDPSRGGALKELMHRGSLIGYFRKGGPIMYPLLCVSILAMTVVLERLVFLAREKRNRAPKVVDEILSRIEEGDVDGAIRAGSGTKDFVARALAYAIQHREKSLSNALIRAGAAELHRFTRGISILDTCVTMAPLLGLLGTVTGMMGSFGMLGGAELSAPSQITGGIAEALIATAFGLGIAITSLIPMNYLHNQAERAKHEIEDASTHLELLMKPILDVENARREERVLAQLARDAASRAVGATA
ncbi:MAG TPA: MotA/TolQ/ExbB proton channel family protein [Candidatus Polarisedimenticolaceae bacterium]|nr:MotA/TolQ/ExbB proton channel family protein [Candidatus Polarisedimenticolaceae bacterium]